MTTATLQGRPVLGEPVRWHFPALDRDRLPNGLTVLGVHLPGKLVASAAVLVDLPVDSDPAGREGLAAVAASALSEGTDERDAEAFADALERQGASFDADAGYRGLSALLAVPVSRLEAGLGLLAEAVTRPAFGAPDVDRVVQRRLAQIDSTRSNPAGRAALEFTAALHQPGTRMAVPDGGTRETVAPITAADVAAGYAARAAAATSTLLVAGDLTGLDVSALAAAAFGDWTGAAAEPWTPTEPGPDTGHRAVIVDRPGSVQTQLVLGHSSADRRSPAWPAMTLAAYAVGGTLTSRIDAVLREEKGYTYGMRGRFEAHRRTGTFTVSGSVDTQNTPAALRDLDGILRVAVEGGLTPQEHAAARDYLVGVSPMRWETPGSVARQLISVVGNDLPVDWVDGFLDGMRAATLADLDAALRAQVRPADLLLVAVGEAATIADPLRDLGYGEPVVLTS